MKGKDMSITVSPVQSKFRAAIRWWKNGPPEIVCVCLQCFQISITRDTYGLYQWINMHAEQPCNAILIPTDFTEQIEKALAEVRLHD